jgi:hypothetical protein
LLLESANTGSFDDSRGKVWHDKSFRDMVTSPSIAVLMTFLAKNFPYWFYKNIVLPDLSLFEGEEFEREVKHAKTIPNFKKDYMM